MIKMPFLRHIRAPLDLNIFGKPWTTWQTFVWGFEVGRPVDGIVGAFDCFIVDCKWIKLHYPTLYEWALDREVSRI